MSMVGTFDGFTAARLGIYAAQHGLRVTGNNVANINTMGYTRQRADQVSFKVGANDIYKSFYDNHVGSGALVTSISQLRDPYLDIRFRNASNDTYHYDTWLSGMQNIASILDEVGKGDNQDGLIYKAIQDLAEKLRSYSANPTSLNDRLVRNSADSLTLLFHNAADRLEKLYNETVNEFNEDVSAVNEILTNIRDLNKTIREAEIHGDAALEMRDERNRQIDALSQYLDIKVQYSFEDVGGGIQVEKLTIKLNNANPDDSVHTDESVLVDGIYATQLSVPKELPARNTYGGQYWYLKGFTYLKKIAADEDALKQYFDENGLKMKDFLKTETTEDGTYYIVGTKIKGDASTKEVPIVNEHIDDEDSYLKGYEYIIKIPVDDADPDEQQALDDFLLGHDGLNKEDLIKSEDGKYFIIGTHEQDEASKEEVPIDNEYDDPYLAGYDYIIKIPVEDTDTLEQYLNDIKLSDLLLTQNPYIEETADGEEESRIYFLFGTNNPDEDGLYTEPNENFTLQLGKLLNSKGEEWKTHTTAWVELTSKQAPSKAVYTYPIDFNVDDINGLTFKIANANGSVTEYTVGEADDTGEVVPTDKAELLQFIANKLNNTDPKRYPGYTISSNGESLIFTADKPGAVGSDAEGVPAEPPKLEVTTDTGDPGWIYIDPDKVTEKPGYLPDDMGTVETDEHGNVTKTVNYVQVDGKWYQLTIGTQYTYDVVLDDNDIHGILQAERELLTEEGEFSSEKDVAIDEGALTKRGIPYYMKSLDLLAQKFAKAYNQLNSGYAYNQDGNYIDETGYPLMLEDSPVSVDGKLTDGQLQSLIDSGYFLMNDLGQPIDKDGSLILGDDGQPLGYFRADKDGNAIDKDGNYISVDDNGVPMKADTLSFDENGKPSIDEGAYEKLVSDFDSWLDENGWKLGGDLFTNLDGTSTTGITAKTISISHGWSNGLWNLVPTFKMLFTDSGGLTHSTQNDNADHMVAMIDNALTYNPRDLDGSDAIGPELFTGSFNDMLSNMMSVEGEDASITNVRLTTYATTLTELDYGREGVSGVDLNDEAMNMITYSKAMSAAMRVMTTIDEMLDRLINNTAV